MRRTWLSCPVSFSSSSLSFIPKSNPDPSVLVIHALPWLSIAMPFPLKPPVENTSALVGALAGNRVTWSPSALVIQIRSCWSIARWKGSVSLQGLSLLGLPSPARQKNCTLSGSPFGKWMTWSFSKSSVQTSPLGVTMMPCITPSCPPKLYPSDGESGLPFLSNREIVLLPVLVPHTRSCASIAVPKPGPSTPPPLKPVGDGDSGLPLGGDFERFPSQKSSEACEPTMKLTPVQALPSLSNMIFPGALSPPPVN